MEERGKERKTGSHESLTALIVNREGKIAGSVGKEFSVRICNGYNITSSINDIMLRMQYIRKF